MFILIPFDETEVIKTIVKIPVFVFEVRDILKKFYHSYCQFHLYYGPDINACLVKAIDKEKSISKILSKEMLCNSKCGAKYVIRRPIKD